MNPIIVIAIIIIWLYILSVTKRAKLHAWSFMWGSLGLFVIMMMTVQPLLTMPLARCVAAMAGIVAVSYTHLLIKCGTSDRQYMRAVILRWITNVPKTVRL